MKKYIILVSFLFGVIAISNAQIYVQATSSAAIGGSNIFLDASSLYSDQASAPANVGKGLLIPSVDLVNFQFDLTLADGFTFPSYFDGMLVYNNASGTTLTAGNRSSTATGVSAGFYYFSNPGSPFNVTSGQWLPVGGGASTAMAISDGVAVDSRAIVNGTQEKVVRLATIAADGVNTTLDLHAALTTAVVTVAKFRKAAIYNAAGDLVMHATGGYTTGTDILVTGNGMMNKLLPVGTYSVEVYYTE